MNVYLNGTNIESRKNKTFSYQEFLGDLEFEIYDEGIHTVIMYDMSTNPIYINYLVEDILKGNLEAGTNTISYEEPYPKSSGINEYFIDLYEQPFILNSHNSNSDVDRHYDFKPLIRINDLKLVKRIILNVAY